MHAISPTVTGPSARRAPLIDIEELPPVDRPAAEALAAAMASWNASELDAYRGAVIDELSTTGGARVRGFLAVELAALASLADGGA